MSNDVPTSGPQTIPTAPGILFVSSKSLDATKLDPEDFCTWYEGTHIPEIHQTGGFSRTQRYESLSFSKQYHGTDISAVPENKNYPYDFLTTYNMPDLHFRETEEFASLSKKASPDDQNLVEKLFKQAEFFSRFCEQMAVDWPNEGGPDAPYLVTLTSSSADSAKDLAIKVTKFSGCERTRQYHVHEGSVLSALQRTYVPEKSELYLFEFGDVEHVVKVAEMFGDQEGMQVGFWKLRRSFEGSERTAAVWKPSK